MALVSEPRGTHDIPEQSIPGHEATPLTGTKLAIICIALCLAVLLVALVCVCWTPSSFVNNLLYKENTILATGIPSITDEFKTMNSVGWYVSAYLLTTCTFQLFYGKLYTFFSMKKVFLAAVSIFEIGSAICGAAPSSVIFIIGRAIAGLGSAGIVSGALIITGNSAPLHRRPIREYIIVTFARLPFTNTKKNSHWSIDFNVWSCFCGRPFAWQCFHWPCQLAVVERSLVPRMA